MSTPTQPALPQRKTFTYVDENSTIYESILLNGKPAFIYVDNGVFKCIDSLQNKVEEILPLTDSLNVYIFKSIPSSLKTKQELMDSIMKELSTFLIMTEHNKLIIACFILASYFQDKFGAVPYLLLSGETDTGKSDAEKIVNSLGYRSVYFQNVTGPNLWIKIDKHKVKPLLVCLDEYDPKTTEISDVLRNGQKRGGIVARLYGDDKTKQMFFTVFCMKIIASMHDVTDKSILNRSIVIYTYPGVPTRRLTDINVTSGEAYQGEIVYFRDLKNDIFLWSLMESLPTLTSVQSEVITLIDGIAGRFREVWLPLLMMAYGTTHYPMMEEIIKDRIGAEFREQEMTMKGRIARILNEYVVKANQYNQDIPFSEIWEQWLSHCRFETPGFIHNNKMHDWEMLSVDEQRMVTNKEISKILRKTFGANKVLKGGVTYYSFDKSLPNMLAKYMPSSKKPQASTQHPLVPSPQSSPVTTNAPPPGSYIALPPTPAEIAQAQTQLEVAEAQPQQDESWQFELETNTRALTQLINPKRREKGLKELDLPTLFKIQQEGYDPYEYVLS